MQSAASRVSASVSRAPWGVYAGLFFITMATLMYELVLTRIFSVITLYHFAFMAVSVGMLGATAAALTVYLLPRHFTLDRARTQMGEYALLFSGSIVVAMLMLAYVPFTFEKYWMYGWGDMPKNYVHLTAVFFSVILPFFFGGIAITLGLTKFPGQISRLYAADLIGAAFGCVLVIVVLNMADGPTALIFAALVAVLSSLLIYSSPPRWTGWGIAFIAMTALAAFGMTNTVTSKSGRPLVRLMWVKGWFEEPVLFEKWNSFSRVTIGGDMNAWERPVGWGLSQKYDGAKVRQLGVVYDAGASTQMTHFDGETSDVQYLKYDIVNLANHLRSEADVLAIGSGGGRDILSAIVFEQNSVTGVEINNETVAQLREGPFADFTGHLDDIATVTLINDEARSFVERSQSLYDVIQISLIDTWAASSAGAYSLTENSLYTVEAWETFLNHLKPGGVLTCSRWYNKLGPTEVYRTVALASKALRNIGVVDPRKNIIGIRTTDDRPNEFGVAAATLVVSNQAFTEEDLANTRKFCEEMGFKVFLAPGEWESEEMMKLAKGKASKMESKLPVRLRPSTDDNPFFFNYIKFKDVINRDAWKNEFFEFNMKATMVLGYLLIGLGAITFLCLILPLLLSGKVRGGGPSFWPLMLYFAGAGLGFMLVEISQMQRLIIFLGHPIYGLSVVLFSVLLASGIGSFFTHRVQTARGRMVLLGCLLVVLGLFGEFTPGILNSFRSAPNALRVAVSVAVLLPMGFFLGVCFPIGMSIAQARVPQAAPWFWGINGATSVLASVIAITISLFEGISAAFWTGYFCYVVVVLAAFWLLRSKAGTPVPATAV